MIEKLTLAGVRVITVDVKQLLDARASNDPERVKFQADTYAIMMLARSIDKNTPKDSAIYRTLSFFVRSHFAIEGTVAVDDYIHALATNDVSRLIKGYLAYKPAEAYRVPEYSTVAAALISA